jgi:thiol-disulfide isomerase/thioredoxin
MPGHAFQRQYSQRPTRRTVATFLACIVAGPGSASAATPGEVTVGESLRDVSMQGLNGPSKKLSEFRGRPLIINVWASWCGPCRQESASLERLAWRNQDGQFNMIGISTDDYPDKARAFLRASNATISHFIDRNLVLENMLGASQLPLTVLVDADGRVVDKIYGAKEWDGPEAAQRIRQAFRRSAMPPARPPAVSGR